MRLLVVLAVFGCKKKTAQLDLPEIDLSKQDDIRTIGRALTPVGAGQWEGAGVTLYVPPGWTGLSGTPAPVVLSIREEQTGVKLDLLVFERDPDGPRPLDDQECSFIDRGSYRSVPALGRAQVATCVGEDATRQVWWGSVEGRPMHVEVTYPSGEAVHGRQAVAPILKSLQRTF